MKTTVAAIAHSAMVSGFSLALLIATTEPAQSQVEPAISEKVLYSFGSSMDGVSPQSTLIRDSKGNLYGTTSVGGTSGVGTIFQLTPGGTERHYSFTGGADGANPSGPLVRDAQGNLYGTATNGATYGTAFELTRTGKLKVLHSFVGGVADGSLPLGGMVRDSQGNLYGATKGGGLNNWGIVFKIAPDGTESILHSFDEFSEGGQPLAGLILDAQGNLYGTAWIGGLNGGGTVFEVSLNGMLTVLFSFGGFANDGSEPMGPLVRDGQGNLYGTTVVGGTGGGGIVFKVTPTGTETILHNFTAITDGVHPIGGLLRDSKGNLYGMTPGGGQAGKGVVFRVTPGGNESVIYNFAGIPDGAAPYAGLLPDGKGGAYGTTSGGGANQNGSVFQLGP